MHVCIAFLKVRNGLSEVALTSCLKGKSSLARKKKGRKEEKVNGGVRLSSNTASFSSMASACKRGVCASLRLSLSMKTEDPELETVFSCLKKGLGAFQYEAKRG